MILGAIFFAVEYFTLYYVVNVGLHYLFQSQDLVHGGNSAKEVTYSTCYISSDVFHAGMPTGSMKNAICHCSDELHRQPSEMAATWSTAGLLALVLIVW